SAAAALRVHPPTRPPPPPPPQPPSRLCVRCREGGRKMKAWNTDVDAPTNAEKGAAGKELDAEEPFFVSPFRERVLYSYFMVQIVGLSVVIVTLFILQYIK
ncbi:unnamed protein product, partial [Urochloa humidicola]